MCHNDREGQTLQQIKKKKKMKASPKEDCVFGFFLNPI